MKPAMASAEATLMDGPRGRACASCGGHFPANYRLCPHDGTLLEGGAGVEDPLLGTLVGGTYRIVRPLGSGGMGLLYEAEHHRLDRRYAIKVLHGRYARVREAEGRLSREARAAGGVRSPHVVDVVDYLRTADGRPCMVAELLDGEDLGARLAREGRLGAEEAVDIARQVCRGLAAAHARGVVHRDLKPSNIFVTTAPDGRSVIKLLDFGVAKLAGADDITREGAVVGTPAYMAPEQARGAGGVDVRADVYGVGAVLYHMVTGRPPYPKGGATQTLANLLSEEPPRPRALDRTVSAALEAVIQHAMARDPGERIPNAVALEAQLRALEEREGDDEPLVLPADGSGTVVLPAGSVARAHELVHRARFTRPLAVLLVLFGTLSAGCAAALLLSPLARALAFEAHASSIASVAALAVMIGVGFGGGRMFASRWRSVIAVRARLLSGARALVLSWASVGFLFLLATGARAAGLASEPSELMASVASALFVAVAAAMVARL